MAHTQIIHYQHAKYVIIVAQNAHHILPVHFVTQQLTDI